jgi:hypothetical protein
MDGSRFDGLARTLVAGTDRRRVLLGAGVVAALLGTASRDATEAARRKRRRPPVGAETTPRQGRCQAPWLVSIDPANPGVEAQAGNVTKISDRRLIGSYRGDGRFAGYAKHGLQDAIVNTKTGTARVRGEFTVTSPDGGSSIRIRYTGQVDFATGVATGHFVAGDGTGNDVGYHAAGTIEAMLVAPNTLDGVDIGLC